MYLLWATPQKHYKKYLNVTVFKWNFSRSLLWFLSTAGRRAFASGGPAWRSGAAGTSESWGALDSGENHAAARGPPLQTQHHHLLHEAQVDPYALEARPQGRLWRGGGASRGESVTSVCLLFWGTFMHLLKNLTVCCVSPCFSSCAPLCPYCTFIMVFMFLLDHLLESWLVS